MTEVEKASVRACLDQTTIALAEARMITGWWHTLGPDVRRQYQEFEALGARLHRNLEEVRKMGPAGFVPEP